MGARQRQNTPKNKSATQWWAVCRTWGNYFWSHKQAGKVQEKSFRILKGIWRGLHDSEQQLREIVCDRCTFNVYFELWAVASWCPLNQASGCKRCHRVIFSYRENAGGRHGVLAALQGRLFLLVGGATLALNLEVSPAGGTGTPGPLDPERMDIKYMQTDRSIEILEKEKPVFNLQKTTKGQWCQKKKLNTRIRNSKKVSINIKHKVIQFKLTSKNWRRLGIQTGNGTGQKNYYHHYYYQR